MYRQVIWLSEASARFLVGPKDYGGEVMDLDGLRAVSQ